MENSSNHLCSCGAVIPHERLNALTLNGKYPERIRTALCVKCAESKVQRKAGYHVSSSKLSKGELVVADQDTVNQFYKDSARNSGHTTSSVTKAHRKGGWM